MVSAIGNEAIVVTNKGTAVTATSLNAALAGTPYRLVSWDAAPADWRPAGQ